VKKKAKKRGRRAADPNEWGKREEERSGNFIREVTTQGGKRGSRIQYPDIFYRKRAWTRKGINLERQKRALIKSRGESCAREKRGKKSEDMI